MRTLTYTSVKTARQQIILFKFSNLSVTIHFALSLFYLDLGRQYLAALEIQSQQIKDAPSTMISDISPKESPTKGENKVEKEKYLSDLDLLYNDIMRRIA